MDPLRSRGACQQAGEDAAREGQGVDADARFAAGPAFPDPFRSEITVHTLQQATGGRSGLLHNALGDVHYVYLEVEIAGWRATTGRHDGREPLALRDRFDRDTDAAREPVKEGP